MIIDYTNLYKFISAKSSSNTISMVIQYINIYDLLDKIELDNHSIIFSLESMILPFRREPYNGHKIDQTICIIINRNLVLY